MKAGRKTTRADEPTRAPSAARRTPAGSARRTSAPRTADGTARAARPRGGRGDTRRDARHPHEPGAVRRAPQTAPVARPVEKPSRAKSATQAKARAKARKAKAPKVVRTPLRERLRERLVSRLAGVDLRPQALLARIPFVVLVIGALGLGLAITLSLSTVSAGRSYQLSSARNLNDALSQQKEALERDVLQAESAPALAEAARNLGMIPSKDTAHLVQDATGNWVVVGKPKPAEGVPPPPLNTKLPDPKPPAPATPAPRPPLPPGAEVPVRITAPGLPGGPVLPGAVPGPEAAVRLPASASLPPGLAPVPSAPPAADALIPAAPAPVADLNLPPGLSMPVVEIPTVPTVSVPLAPLPALPVPAVPVTPGVAR